MGEGEGVLAATASEIFNFFEGDGSFRSSLVNQDGEGNCAGIGPVDGKRRSGTC